MEESPEGVNRLAVSKEAPSRKGKRQPAARKTAPPRKGKKKQLSWYDRTFTLKGLRV